MLKGLKALCKNEKQCSTPTCSLIRQVPDPCKPKQIHTFVILREMSSLSYFFSTETSHITIITCVWAEAAYKPIVILRG